MLPILSLVGNGHGKAYLEENWILHFKLLLAKRTLKVCSDHRKYMQFEGYLHK